MTAPRPHYLVCPPSFYQVAYTINAWMRPEVWRANEGYWTARSREQWRALTDAMRRLDWGLKTVEPRPDLPDMVFTANHALVIGRRALVARFVKPERQGETEHARRWLADEGFEARVCPTAFEGAGDALYDAASDVIFMGHGFRSSPEAALDLADFFGKKVVPLRLRDPRFYHLDTCLCPLAGGRALFTPLAFTAEGQEVLRRHYGEGLIEIPDDDALRFGCNAVNFGRDVVLPTVGEATTAALRERGFTPHLVELDSFLLAGGASRCLTLRLDET
ncbi:MAG TPA: arginine deiminase-related protein [Polyangiaceae bacterium]|nr:arginine deiminase-related protein [Polyangiaceae bacterium]